MGLCIEDVVWSSRFVEPRGDVHEGTCMIVDTFSFEILFIRLVFFRLIE